MKLSDFIISTQDVPIVIIDRIYEYHFMPLQVVEVATPFKIYPSAKSCYRSYVWEIARGRNGKSQHTFGQRATKILDGKGACDITCDNFKDNKDKLLNALIKDTPYLRLAVYWYYNKKKRKWVGFIHGDYKDTHNGKRLLFTSGADSKWKFSKFIT